MPWFLATYLCKLLHSNVECTGVRDSSLRHARCKTKDTDVGDTADELDHVPDQAFEKNVEVNFIPFLQKSDDAMKQEEREALRENLESFKDGVSSLKNGLLIIRDICIILAVSHCIWESAEYLENYLRNLQFDNNYIGPYFRQRDRQRKARG